MERREISNRDAFAQRADKGKFRVSTFLELSLVSSP
jgi:hypothetical protein